MKRGQRLYFVDTSDAMYLLRVASSMPHSANVTVAVSGLLIFSFFASLAVLNALFCAALPRAYNVHTPSQSDNDGCGALCVVAFVVITNRKKKSAERNKNLLPRLGMASEVWGFWLL